MNIWLKEQGLALVPAPEPISIKPADPTVTTPLLKAILDAPDQAARDRAADAIEALGLPALHPVLDQLAAVKGATGAKADLEALSRRLASIVREVTVEAESVKPNDAIVKAMDAVKGKPLTPHRFIDLVLAGMQNLPADAAGVRVKAERMEDLTGVVVTVKLLRQRVHLGESQKGWDVTEIVRGDSKTLTFSVTGSVFEYALKAEAYTNFIRAAQKAIDLPPQTTIELQLTATLKD
jgi:hypothetical protein